MQRQEYISVKREMLGTYVRTFFFRNNVFTPLVDKISETTKPIFEIFTTVPYTYA